VAALTWSTLQTTLQAIIARTPAPWTFSDPAFNQLFPQSTSYAENRIYHEMPVLAQRDQDTSLTTTSGSRSISLHGTALPIVVPERLALITPSGSTLANGTQVPFIPVSLDFIDLWWPNQSLTWAPASALAAYWCIQGGVSGADFISPNVVIAPTPDAAYKVVLTGLFQQEAISEDNPQTYLSTVYPECMLAACMIFLSGALLRNYGSAGAPSQPDEAGMPIHWEGQFGRLIESAKAEEMRRRGQGALPFTQPPSAPGMPGPPGRPG
jgi:hypothetical protein